MNNNKQFKSSDGYVYVYDPIRAYPLSYIKQAIIVLEQKIGRRLQSHEVSHHINHIRDDDSPKNLEVLSISEHSRLHMKEMLVKRWGQSNSNGDGSRSAHGKQSNNSVLTGR